METIAQIFGLTFVGVIIICLAYTLAEIIFSKSNKENKKI